MPSITPSFSEFAAKKRKLEEEIYGPNRYTSEPEAPPPPPSTPTSWPPDFPTPPTVDPAKTRLIGVDLLGQEVHTTFGTFPLEDIEASVVSDVLIKCLVNRLQQVIDNLRTVHGILDLEKKQQEALQKQQGGPPPPPQGDMEDVLDVPFHDIDEESPEEEPPSPVARPQRAPRRKKD